MRKLILILCITVGLCACNLSDSESFFSKESNSKDESVLSSAQSEINFPPTSTQTDSSEKSSMPTSIQSTVSTSEEPLPPQTSAPVNSSKTEYTSVENSSEEQVTTSENTEIQTTESKQTELSQPVSENICIMSIECSTVLNNLNALEKGKEEILPPDGVIFAAASVEFSEGESVFDLLKRICRDNKIHMESSWTPMYNSAYIEGINNLYEFDCGSGSGWMYRVNGVYPNYGCSRYTLKRGDVVEWRYTCDLGKDIGGDVLGG